MVLRLLLFFALLLSALPAWAGPQTTRDALERVQETLELRIDEGRLKPEDLSPAVLVSARPRYTDSADWYETRVVEILVSVLGPGALRVCEACKVPRTYVEGGALVYQSGPIGLDEVIRLDEQTRGTSAAARTAIWLDEYRGGVSLRIVDLRNGSVLYAQNVDPMLIETKNTERVYSLAAELERRARGDSLTQTFADFALVPGQHISFDFTDQWGSRNQNLSGATISLFDPLLGVGACHYRRMPFLNMLVGGKVVFSIPTAAANALAQTEDPIEIIDPLVTGAAVVRVPFGRSNYGGVLTVSTNGRVGVGISLMNVQFLPVLL